MASSYYALSSMRRVAITGLGAVTPIGLDAPSTLGGGASPAGAASASSRRSTPSAYPVRIAAEVQGFDPSGARAAEGGAADGPERPARRRRRPGGVGRRGHRGVRPGARRASSSARRSAASRRSSTSSARCMERGGDRLSPFFIPSTLVDTASGQIAIQLGITGPNYAPVSACATGSTAVGEGAAMIVRGQADIVLAGGTEACDHRADPRRLLRHARARGRGRGSDPRDAALRRDAGRLRDGGGGLHPRARGDGGGAGARRADLRRGARLRRLERRPSPRPARAGGDGCRGDDLAPRSRAPVSLPSVSAT